MSSAAHEKQSATTQPTAAARGAPALSSRVSVSQLLLCALALGAVYIYRTSQPTTARLSSLSQPQWSLRFGTYNIRYDGRAREAVPLPAQRPGWDGARSRGTKWGEQPWAERRWAVADQVAWENLDVVGFQEVLTNQLDDLKALLGDEYAWEGVGRDDGKQAGEYVPIAFKKSVFELESVEHFWLSPTPAVPGSIGWDASQTRMATLLKLNFINPPAEGYKGIHVINTHWDDRGVKARAESAQVILDKVAQLQDKALVVLLGDLNSPEKEEAYQRLTGNKYRKMPQPHQLTFWDSAKELAIAQPGREQVGPALLHSPYGARNTYTGFSQNDRADVIDVVLFLANGPVHAPSRSKPDARDGSVWRVNRVGVIPNAVDDGRGGFMSSDHRLTVAAFEWTLNRFTRE